MAGSVEEIGGGRATGEPLGARAPLPGADHRLLRKRSIDRGVVVITAPCPRHAQSTAKC